MISRQILLEGSNFKDVHNEKVFFYSSSDFSNFCSSLGYVICKFHSCPRISNWEPLTTANVSTADVTTSNVSTADVLVLGYGLAYGLCYGLGYGMGYGMD